MAETKKPGSLPVVRSMRAADIIMITKPTRFQKLWKMSAMGVCTVSARSKDAAFVQLQLVLQEQARHRMTRVYRFTKRGVVFALYFNEGWWYDIVSPNHESPSSIGLSTHSYEQALAAMENHWRSYDEVLPNESEENHQ